MLQSSKLGQQVCNLGKLLVANQNFPADRETLARVVGRAASEHRAQAPAILSAALAGDSEGKNINKKRAAKHSCIFVTRVSKAALLAAPDQASALTETAVALYADCADELAAILPVLDRHVEAYGYKDRSDYKDTADCKDRAGAPAAGISNLSDPDEDPGFGIGFGPGFPGSLCFVGSAPGGGFALPLVVLPTPGASPVTSVVNQ